MRFDIRIQSLRIELLLTLGVLVLAALVVGLGSVLLFGDLVEAQRGALYLTLLIIADVCVLVLFGAYQLRRLVLLPLGAVASAAEAIAGGDLARRVPEGDTEELNAVARSINRMTDHLLEERARAIRNEKLASVGRLAAGIAHEIGNPLSAIGGYVHLLRGRVGASPSACEALEGIDRESARIDRIVRGLLDYARPRSVTPAAVELHDVIAGAASILERQGLFKAIELHFTFAPTAPRVLGARHEMEQLFVNLFLNAADAMSGTGTLTVRTLCTSAADLLAARPRRADDPPDFVAPRDATPRQREWLERLPADHLVAKVIVADTGPGVPASDAERIFDPFYTTKEPGRGTGLGLAIVARVVENLHGVVWVQPARGKGATFAMLLPAQTAPAGIRAITSPSPVLA